MMDSERMKGIDVRRQEIFELALNIARLQLHGCYMDEQGRLNFVAHDEIGPYVRNMQQRLEHEAKAC